MLLAVALILCATACHKAGRIIPKSKLEDIYFDMFMADEWLRDNTDVKGIADTTLFYEPIFHRYGYSFKDYDASVSYYIDRPDKFNKIMSKVAKRLNNKYLEYHAIAEASMQAERANRKTYGFKHVDYTVDTVFTSGHFSYRPVTEVQSDTLCEGLVIDSLVVDNVTSTDSIRTHKKPQIRELPGHKPIAAKGEAL